MKRILMVRIVFMVLIAAAILFAVYYGITAFFYPDLVPEKENELRQDSVIEIRTWPAGNVFLLGDSFSYFVEVKYNPLAVREIDKSSLEKTVILEPFEIRNQKEKETGTDSGTKIYTREYEIQLLRGYPARLYVFPEASLRYKPVNEDWTERKIILQSIPVGSRFPVDIQGIELKSIDGVLDNKSRRYFPFFVIGLGILCGAWVMAEVSREIVKSKKASDDFQRKFRVIEDIFRAYQNLAGRKEEPKAILHQAHQILRVLLERKAGREIPSKIRESVARFSSIANKAYSREILLKTELDEALQELRKIFDFYVRKGEGQWKN